MTFTSCRQTQSSTTSFLSARIHTQTSRKSITVCTKCAKTQGTDARHVFPTIPSGSCNNTTAATLSVFWEATSPTARCTPNTVTPKHSRQQIKTVYLYVHQHWVVCKRCSHSMPFMTYIQIQNCCITSLRIPKE
jgi:hypothetical protein